MYIYYYGILFLFFKESTNNPVTTKDKQFLK